MAQPLTSRYRRLAGILFLLGSGLMLVLGDKALGTSPSPLGFVLYWGACLLLVALAFFTAFLDVLSIQRYWVQEKKQVFESSLGDIQKDIKRRRKNEDSVESVSQAPKAG